MAHCETCQADKPGTHPDHAEEAATTEEATPEATPEAAPAEEAPKAE